MAGGEGLRQTFPEGDAAFRDAGGVLPVTVVIESVVRRALDHAAFDDGSVHACVHHRPVAAEQVVRPRSGHEMAVDPAMPAMAVGLFHAGLGGEETAVADDNLAAVVEHDGGRGAVDEPEHVAYLQRAGGTIGSLPCIVADRLKQFAILQREPIQPLGRLLHLAGKHVPGPPPLVDLVERGHMAAVGLERDEAPFARRHPLQQTRAGDRLHLDAVAFEVERRDARIHRTTWIAVHREALQTEVTAVHHLDHLMVVRRRVRRQGEPERRAIPEDAERLLGLTVHALQGEGAAAHLAMRGIEPIVAWRNHVRFLAGFERSPDTGDDLGALGILTLPFFGGETGARRVVGRIRDIQGRRRRRQRMLGGQTAEHTEHEDKHGAYPLPAMGNGVTVRRGLAGVHLASWKQGTLPCPPLKEKE